MVERVWRGLIVSENVHFLRFMEHTRVNHLTSINMARRSFNARNKMAHLSEGDQLQFAEAYCDRLDAQNRRRNQVLKQRHAPELIAAEVGRRSRAHSVSGSSLEDEDPRDRPDPAAPQELGGNQSNVGTRVRTRSAVARHRGPVQICVALGKLAISRNEPSVRLDAICNKSPGRRPYFTQPRDEEEDRLFNMACARFMDTTDLTTALQQYMSTETLVPTDMEVDVTPVAPPVLLSHTPPNELSSQDTDFGLFSPVPAASQFGSDEMNAAIERDRNERWNMTLNSLFRETPEDDTGMLNDLREKYKLDPMPELTPEEVAQWVDEGDDEVREFTQEERDALLQD